MKLDTERIKRYEEKLEFIQECLILLREWIPPNMEEFTRDMKTKKAVYKVVEELADCIMDIVAMMVRDEGKVVRDDYTNLHTLKQLGLITDELLGKLRELNGLRNVLVHRYNGIDDRLAYTSILKLRNSIVEFSEVVKK